MRNVLGLSVRTRWAGVTLLLVVVFLLSACASAVTPEPKESIPTTFDGGRAYQHVLAQCAIGARPAGSANARATAGYIVEQLTAAGWEVKIQEFEYRGVTLRNVIGVGGVGHGAIVLGAHYDTRPVADRDLERPFEPILGANDGASGVAVLLELARVLPHVTVSRPVWLAFFDGEDRGRLDGWDWSIGAAYMAANLSALPGAVVVIDMIGDADQQIFFEENSDIALSQQIWDVAETLQIDTFVPETKWRMIDDHYPFVQQGIPSALLIDFDYPYWHTTEDSIDKVSPASLANVGKVLAGWLEQ